MLYTVTHVLYTESLSSAKLKQERYYLKGVGVAVGEKKTKKMYTEKTASLKICTL